MESPRKKSHKITAKPLSGCAQASHCMVGVLVSTIKLSRNFHETTLCPVTMLASMPAAPGQSDQNRKHPSCRIRGSVEKDTGLLQVTFAHAREMPGVALWLVIFIAQLRESRATDQPVELDCFFFMYSGHQGLHALLSCSSRVARFQAILTCCKHASHGSST